MAHHHHEDDFKLNKLQNDTWGDPEVDARIAQYEMAFRMQISVPEVLDTSKESDEVFDLYGKDSRDKGTLLHLMGIDHEQLTFKFQGRRYRLTDVHGQVINSILT